MEQVITDIMKEVENGSFELSDLDSGVIWFQFLNPETDSLEYAEEVLEVIEDRYGFGYW